MPGPVSDSYDPEFSTADNRRAVAEGIGEARDIIAQTLPEVPLPIVGVANGPQGRAVTVRLTERQRRLIRFGLNRALEEL